VFIALVQKVVEAGSDGLIRTPTTRHQHSRERLRYGSDLINDASEINAPLRLPPGEWAAAEFLHMLFRGHDK